MMFLNKTFALMSFPSVAVLQGISNTDRVCNRLNNLKQEKAKMSESIEELRARVVALKADSQVSGAAKPGETIKASLTELSRATGISLSSISRFASGKGMSGDRVDAVRAYMEGVK